MGQENPQVQFIPHSALRVAPPDSELTLKQGVVARTCQVKRGRQYHPTSEHQEGRGQEGGWEGESRHTGKPYCDRPGLSLPRGLEPWHQQKLFLPDLSCEAERYPGCPASSADGLKAGVSCPALSPPLGSGPLSSRPKRHTHSSSVSLSPRPDLGLPTDGTCVSLPAPAAWTPAQALLLIRFLSNTHKRGCWD